MLPEPIPATSNAVTFNAAAFDAVSGTVAINCSPASGTEFPAGVTTVTCSAADHAGNRTSGSFVVTVTTMDGDIPIAVNDTYGDGREPIEATSTREQSVRFSRRFGVLANDLPINGRGRTVSLVSGPVRIKGRGAADMQSQLQADGAFDLVLTAPSTARSKKEKAKAKRGIYAFAYKMVYKGISSAVAQAVIIVR
jgi:hypothetical protein